MAMGTLLLGVGVCAAGQESLQGLLNGLDSPNPGTRASAAMSLAKMGPDAQDAVPALAKALGDRDLNVRYFAATALQAVGPAAQAGVAALVQALDTFPGGSPALDGPMRYYADVRVVAAEALGAIGSHARAAVPALKKALNDADPTVRSAAAEALKRVAAK